jgi:carbonic anhydrase
VAEHHDKRRVQHLYRIFEACTTLAAVLSCADSRIAPEYCFDTARGDLFVCRVAGNFASDDADEWHDFAQMNIARF